VGLYASLFMLRKTQRAQRGGLDEPSVVTEPHARLFGGIPNALIGSVYYPSLAAAVWIGQTLAVPRWPIVFAVVAAAATSAFLAYSLVFVTKRECRYCWTSHLVNALLLYAVPAALWS
jgi:uncharacterized membrane protein